MSNIVINDLEMNRELDREAMAHIKGGLAPVVGFLLGKAIGAAGAGIAYGISKLFD
jgi:class IIb bacteriocin, lactobin A/cerein 7B family